MSEAIKSSGGFKTMPTGPSEAEMLAAINGIWIAARHGATRILVQTDCMAVVYILEGKPDKRGNLWATWKQFLADYGIRRDHITAKHVKGHSRVQDARSWVNRWCDENAKHHMLAQRKQRKADKLWLTKTASS